MQKDKVIYDGLVPFRCIRVLLRWCTVVVDVSRNLPEFLLTSKKMRMMYQSAPSRLLGALQQPFLPLLFFLECAFLAPRDNLPYNDGTDDDTRYYY
jgi:hypothetical protein